MQIQRYLLKDEEHADFFGIINSEIHNYDFDWYFSDNKIGIIPNESGESRYFYDGILVADDSLIIHPSEVHPRIGREIARIGSIKEHDSPRPDERSKLVKMIMSHDLIHLYISTDRPDGIVKYGGILTFSPIKPSESLYNLGKILPVKTDKDVRSEIEQKIQRMRERLYE